jgi:uncharacterized cupredoxin-like copper-binding protein
MNSKHLSRRELLKATGVAVLGSAVLSNVTVLAQKDPTKADLEIKLGEFYFQVPGKEKNAPIELEAGKELLIKFVNEGKVAHEAHFGKGFDSAKRLYKDELMPGFLGIHLEPNQIGYIHILLSEKQKGEWEIGCLIPGHYEAGQKAKLVVK